MLCAAIQREAQNVVDYTKNIEELLKMPNRRREADAFDDLRIDNVVHLQTLVADLAELFFDVKGEQNERGSVPDKGDKI